MFLARHSFAFHFAVPNSCMVVFKNIREFDPEMLQSIPLPDKLDRELINAAFDWSTTVLTDASPKLLQLCRSATLRDFGFLEEARRVASGEKLEQDDHDPLLRFELETSLSWGYGDIFPV